MKRQLVHPHYPPGTPEFLALRTIAAHRMIEPGQRVAIACSGGADSTALLLILLQLREQLGCVVSVAHYNHRLRGDESDRDEEFVRLMALRLGLDCYTDSGEIRQESLAQRANLEATARRLRYEFFRSLIHAGKVDRVATGHTADDQAETVLMRLLRGAGPLGLGGIRPVLGGCFIRPVLEVRRELLRTWLVERRIDWREDASNSDLQLRRNHIRHQVLPALTSLNPNLVETLARTAALARVDEAFWNRYIPALASRYASQEPAAGRASIELRSLARLPEAAALRLMRFVINELQKPGAGGTRSNEENATGSATELSFAQIRSIYSWAMEHHSQRQTARGQATRKLLTLPPNLDASVRSSHLILQSGLAPGGGKSPQTGTEFEVRIEAPQSLLLPQLGSALTIDFVEVGSASGTYNGGDCCLLDISLAASPLILRNWRPGDAYRPAGRSGFRKLKELFQRQRVPTQLRAGWPVLESTGKIAWAKDFGPAMEYQVRPGSERALRIRLLGRC